MSRNLLEFNIIEDLLEFNIIEEDFPMPVIESICIPVSNDLTCAETAIITKMASYPDADKGN